jgi:hypothetical protein
MITQYVPDGHSKELSENTEKGGVTPLKWEEFAMSSSPRTIPEILGEAYAWKLTAGTQVRFIDIRVPTPRKEESSTGGIRSKRLSMEKRSSVEWSKFLKETTAARFLRLWENCSGRIIQNELWKRLIGRLADLCVEARGTTTDLRGNLQRQRL